MFPPTEQHPVRVEFWGDEVEEVRSFAVADQRTIDQLPRLWAPPCRELLLTDDVRRRAAALSEAHPSLAEMTSKIAAGIAVEGMESLAPVLVDELELLVDAMPDDTQILVVEPERVRSRAHDLVATSEEFLGASWAAAAGGGTAPIDLGAASYRELDDVRAHARELGMPWWTVSPFGLDAELTEGAARGVGRPRSRATAAISNGPWPTSAAGSPTVIASSSSTRVTAPHSAWSRCSPSTTSPPAWSSPATTPPSTRAWSR